MAQSFNGQDNLRPVSGARVRGAPRALFLLGASALFACEGASDALLLASAQQPIFGGSPDSEHSEVMLLANVQGFLCTGTVIAAEAESAFLLTAAHCVTDEAGAALPARDFIVVPGADFAESTRAFSVESIRVEPSYDGSFAANDIAVVRFFFGGEPAPGTIPVLGTADDALDVGAPLLLVGYGQTERDEGNTERRMVTRSIEALDAELIVYSQEDGSGACFGDSGGPVLATVAGEERVAAVISGGVSEAGEGCAGGLGVAIRVSGYEDFIRDALGASAPD